MYMFLKKHPGESKSMFLHANSLIRHLPVDKNSKDLLTPILDFTKITNNYGGMQASL